MKMERENLVTELTGLTGAAGLAGRSMRPVHAPVSSGEEARHA